MAIFATGYYKINRLCLTLCGIWPEQTFLGSCLGQIYIIGTLLGLMIPEIIFFYDRINESMISRAILCVPSVLSIIVGIMKCFVVAIKKSSFRNAIREIRNDWELLGDSPAGPFMHRYAARGRASTLYYMGFLFPALTVFLGFPLVPVFLDFISPLNETRPRPAAFETEYRLENPEDYYVTTIVIEYVASLSLIIILWTVDSFIMVLVQHCCGLFEIVGFTLQRINTEREKTSKTEQDNLISFAISIHKRAILFADFIEDTLTTMYAYVICINMVAISITGVGSVFQLDQFDQALRFGLLGIGQMAHLFFNSIPGQQLIDHSHRVFEAIYYAEWHLISIKSRKLILMMLIRSNKPNSLTAGGFYELNMENFSQVLQTSMSYMTVLVSMR